MFCSQCGTALPDGSKFCNTCGATLKTIYQPEPETVVKPTAEPPVESVTEPASLPFETPVAEKSIAKAIASIALGAHAIGVSCITFFFALILAAEWEGKSALIITLFFGVFALPVGIIGIVMGSRYLSTHTPRLHGTAVAGTVLSILSVSLIALAFIISLITIAFTF